MKIKFTIQCNTQKTHYSYVHNYALLSRNLHKLHFRLRDARTYTYIHAQHIIWKEKKCNGNFPFIFISSNENYHFFHLFFLSFWIIIILLWFSCNQFEKINTYVFIKIVRCNCSLFEHLFVRYYHNFTLFLFLFIVKQKTQYFFF